MTRHFVARHTVGFDALAAQLARHDLAWASAATGLDAGQIAFPRAPLRGDENRR